MKLNTLYIHKKCRDIAIKIVGNGLEYYNVNWHEITGLKPVYLCGFPDYEIKDPENYREYKEFEVKYDK